MKEINEQIIERYMLSIERIRRITEEETTEVLYRDYFRKVSEFILKIDPPESAFPHPSIQYHPQPVLRIKPPFFFLHVLR